MAEPTPIRLWPQGLIKIALWICAVLIFLIVGRTGWGFKFVIRHPDFWRQCAA
jgi:hypothetical protein